MDMTQMEAMLQLIDPAHGFIIDNNVGLMGYFDTYAEKRYNDLKNIQNLIYSEVSPTVGKLSSKGNDGKRGEYFKVIDSEGCILIDQFVINSGILYRNNESFAYAFVLKDYKSKQPFDDFFDEDGQTPAVIIYEDGNLYINNVVEDNLTSQYKYDDSIRIEFIKVGEYKLVYKNEIYMSYVINADNKVSVYKHKEIHL